MNIEIAPSFLSGTVTPPASKSVAHRALIAAALCPSPTLLQGNLQGDDVERTADCLCALGASIARTKDGWLVTPIGKNRVEKAQVNVGSSGSTLRFMLPVCAALGTETSFVCSKRLAKRPVGSLLEELKKHGVEINGDTLPLTIKNKLCGNEFMIDASVSSQYITGLLLALPLLGGGKIKAVGEIVSKDYLTITKGVLAAFGVMVTEENGEFVVSGQYRSPETFSVESDWSSAGFFAVAGAKGDIVLNNVITASTQGDKAVLAALRAAGASVNDGRAVRIRSGDLHAFTFDVENCPDAAPILSVLAACCEGKSVLTGTSRLKLKESDRAKEIVRLLGAFGIQATDHGDRIEIVGGKLTGCSFDLPDDHRIAMAAAIAAANATGKTVLRGAECVNKSYPSFFDDYGKVGGKVNVLTL